MGRIVMYLSLSILCFSIYVSANVYCLSMVSLSNTKALSYKTRLFYLGVHKHRDPGYSYQDLKEEFKLSKITYQDYL